MLLKRPPSSNWRQVCSNRLPRLGGSRRWRSRRPAPAGAGVGDGVHAWASARCGTSHSATEQINLY